MSVLDRIKELMADMSVAELAELLGEKQTRVSSIFYGKQRIPLDFVEKIVIRFEVDANWLLFGSGEPPKPELTPKEAALLDNFRHCPEDEQEAIVKTSALFAQREDKKGKKVKKAG